MKKVLCFFLFISFVHVTVSAQIKGSLWEVPGIYSTPAYSKTLRDSVYEIIYSGVDYKGSPKKTFAYYATPGSLSGKPDKPGSLPVVVLVHGGGGTAFIGWAIKWARLGYAALAMDTRGNYPDGHHLPGGFDEGQHGTPIYDVSPALQEQWFFQAIADILMAHNLVRSFSETDSSRTGLVGISWGAVLSLVAAGLDHRFKSVAPIYGCGFFPTSPSLGQGLEVLSSEHRDTWIRQYDPAHYVATAPMPILMLNGTNDPAFFLDSYMRTCSLIRHKQLSIQIGLQHGHYSNRMGYDIEEPYAFIGQYLQKGNGLLIFTKEQQERDGAIKARLRFKKTPERVVLNYTTDTSSNLQERKWQSKAVGIKGSLIYSGKIPVGARMWYFSVTDAAGLQSSGTIYQLEKIPMRE